MTRDRWSLEPLDPEAVHAFGAVLELPTWVGTAAVLGVGVVLPQLVNNYLDRRTAAD